MYDLNDCGFLLRSSRSLIFFLGSVLNGLVATLLVYLCAVLGPITITVLKRIKGPTEVLTPLSKEQEAILDVPILYVLALCFQHSTSSD